jgi:hypothetical protein
MMPQVLSVKALPGFKENRPVIPPGGVYIGRRMLKYGLLGSKWANRFKPTREADREACIAAFERWLRGQPRLMATLPELRGLDLYCWCRPEKACHGDVLLRLANETPP